MELQSNISIFPILSPSKKTCGDNCFMIDQNQDKMLLHNWRTSSVNDKKTSGAEIWTGSEQSLFFALYPIYPKNYCKLAAGLMTKSCKEIYKYAQANFEKLSTYEYRSRLEYPVEKRTYSQILYKLRIIHEARKNKPVHEYIPCAHEGKCTKGNCYCMKSSNFCEKYCKCNKSCINRFPGCRCKGFCINKSCLCFGALRECDPDLCKPCGSWKYDVSDIACRNVSIQRGLRKEVIIAPSEVHGWGCFLKYEVQRNEFIMEYCGELISQNEAERRGQFYDELKCSYLFNLNSEYVVDATRKGNQVRFINHSVNPNCYAKIKMVNGDHRVGIFSKRCIDSGEELFFDYRYGLSKQIKFVPK